MTSGAEGVQEAPRRRRHPQHLGTTGDKAGKFVMRNEGVCPQLSLQVNGILALDSRYGF